MPYTRVLGPSALCRTALDPVNSRVLFSVLRHRDFKHLWLGQAISQLGDSLYFLVFLFMVKRLGGSDAMVGIVGALQALPYVVVGPFAGMLADRLDRRLIMVMSDVLSTAILGFLAVLLFFDSTPHVAWVMVSGFLLSCVNSVFVPAKSAALPRLLPAEDLQEANALSMATQNFAPLIGIGLNLGVLSTLEAIAPDYFFLVAVVLNMATFCVSASYLARLPKLLPERGEEEHQHPIQDLKDGFRMAWSEPVIRTALWAGAGVSFCVAPFMIIHLRVNEEWYGGKFWTLSLFEGAFVFSMVISSLVLGKIKIVHPGRAYLLGMTIIAIFVAAMAASRNIWLYTLWNFVCGLGLPLASIPITYYIQVATPDAFRGRVMSLFGMVSQAVAPIGMLIGGWLLSQMGPAPMFLVMGGGMGVMCLLLLASRPFLAARQPEPEATSA